MYRAIITRADGTKFDLYSPDHDSLLEATSVLVFNMKLFYKKINIYEKKIMLKEKGVKEPYYLCIGWYDEAGKYVRKE